MSTEEFSCLLFSYFFFPFLGASMVAKTVKSLPAAQDPCSAGSLGQEDPLEKEMATHSSILSCLENSTDKGAWCLSSWGCKESDRTEQLHFLSFLSFFSFSCYVLFIYSFIFVEVRKAFTKWNTNEPFLQYLHLKSIILNMICNVSVLPACVNLLDLI